MTKSDNADIRELQTQMVDVNNKIDEVKADVKTLIAKFDEQKNLQVEIDYLKNEVKDLKKRRTFINLVVPIICTVLASTFTFLLISFINHLQPTSSTSSTTTTTQNQN